MLSAILSNYFFTFSRFSSCDQFWFQIQLDTGKNFTYGMNFLKKREIEFEAREWKWIRKSFLFFLVLIFSASEKDCRYKGKRLMERGNWVFRWKRVNGKSLNFKVSLKKPRAENTLKRKNRKAFFVRKKSSCK